MTYTPKLTAPNRKSRRSQRSGSRATRARATRCTAVPRKKLKSPAQPGDRAVTSASKKSKAAQHKDDKQETRDNRKKRDARPIDKSKSLRVVRHMDQTGENEWLTVRLDGKVGLSSLDRLLNAPGAFFNDLKRSGVRAFTGKSRSAIIAKAETAKLGSPIYVATVPGHHRGAYVAVDGTVFGEAPDSRFHVRLPTKLPCAMKGTYKGWRRTVRKFAGEQPIYKLALSLSFMGPVMELMGWPNVLVELVSTSSTGKTTGLNFTAVTWGAPLNTPGSMAISLRNTQAKLEKVMMKRGGAVFLGDEVNHLGNEARQAERLPDFAFALAEGREVGRYYDDDESGHVPIAHMPSLLTSNISIATLMRDASPDRVGAVLVRLITVPADAGAGFGVLHQLPAGYDTAGAAITALERELQQHYGHAGNRFIRLLLRAWKRDRHGVQRQLEEWAESFLVATKVDRNDGPALRVAQAFARIYAVGQLARRFKVLPLLGLQRSTLVCYRASVAALPRLHRPQPLRSPLELVKQYVEANREHLVDLDAGSPPRVRKRDLDEHPGWLQIRQGRRCVFLRRRVFEKLVGSANTAAKELKALGMLQCNAALQLQTKVRKGTDHDRVYAIVID